jgi:hypothetical protein
MPALLNQLKVAIRTSCAIAFALLSLPSYAALTGSCASIGQVRSVGEGPFSNDPGRIYIVNYSAIFNFDRNTISVSYILRTKTTGDDDIYTERTARDSAVQLTADSLFQGAYIANISVSIPEGIIGGRFRIIPVNSGNSYLIQALQADWVSICQKL